MSFSTGTLSSSSISAKRSSESSNFIVSVGNFAADWMVRGGQTLPWSISDILNAL
eukprot:13753.XXX_1181161_1181325_1 [CDS] Oithona nana genome sequencing.